MRRRIGFALLLGCAACQGPRLVGDVPSPAQGQDPQPLTQARLLLQAGDVTAALQELLAGIQHHKDQVRLHLLYQDVARSLGGEAEAAMRQYYQAWSASNERHTSPLPDYLQARLADTSYSQGVALETLLARFPDFAWAQLSTARVMRRQGRLQLAVHWCSRAIQQDPRLTEALVDRAAMQAELGHFLEAAQDYEAWLKQDHSAAVSRAYIELLLYSLRRAQRAKELLGPLLDAAPADLSLRMHLAAADWQLGDLQAALLGFVGVLEQDPEQARAAYNIGMIYYEALPKSAADRARHWPKAARAFRWFLSCQSAADGHERFERVFGAPYRLEQIHRQLPTLALSSPLRDVAALRP